MLLIRSFTPTRTGGASALRFITIQWLVCLALLYVLMFGLQRLTPGGPCAAYVGVLSERISHSRCDRALALQSPLPVQFAAQLGLYVRGDLGTTNLGHPVTGVVRSAVPATFVLWLAALTFLAAGWLVRQLVGWWTPGGFMSRLSDLGATLPGFWIGLMLLLVVAYHLKSLPASHAQAVTIPAVGSRLWLHELVGRPFSILGDLARHLVLPSGLLAYMVAGVQTQVATRVGQLEITHGPRRAARQVAHYLPALIGATVLIESIFLLNGLGYLFARSLTGQDYATVLALFLLASVACLTSALLAEALDSHVDPASPVEAVPRIDGA